MTRKDRTEGIFSRREVLDAKERKQYYLIQLKELLTYAYRYSEDVKKRFDRAQFNVEKFKTLSDIKHIPILKKKELIFLQSMGPRLGGLLTKDIGDLKRIFLSPGPSLIPRTGPRTTGDTQRPFIPSASAPVTLCRMPSTTSSRQPG